MLRSLLAFEIKLHTRQVGFWVALVIMLCVGVSFSSFDMFSSGGERVKTNGAIPIALLMSAFSLFSIFFAAVFVVTGVMRDDTHKVVEIIHATPVKTRDMLLSRMLGVWFVTVLTLAGLAIGTMFGPFMFWSDAETFKSFNLLHYIQPFFLFIVVNAFIVSGIYTAIAVITRNRAIVYVSAVGLLVLYLIGGIVAGEQPAEWLAALVDPFGATALAVETQYWPAAEQNENMAPMTGWVGINRLIFGLVGLALFAVAFMLSSRGIMTRRSQKSVDDSAFDVPVRVTPVAPTLGLGFTLQTFWTRVKFEYLSTVRSTAFIILAAIALALFGVVLLAILMLGTSTTLPTSQFMTQIALGSLLFPMLIIMVFFGSDIMWRDRTANLHGILDATPVRNVSLLFAKWGALALLLLTLIMGLLIAGMIAQIFIGWDKVPVVPTTFLAIGLISFYVGFFFQGMLVMFIQNFMPGRIIGMLVGGGVLIGLIFFIGQLPFYHPLMNFGSASAGGYSEMAGFSNPKGFGWEFAYWMGLILILGALSVWVWRRGTQADLNYRLRTVGKRLTLPSIATAVLGLALFAGFGFAGLQSYQDANYMNSDQREENSADFEKLVGDMWKLREPRITTVSVKADFFPDTQTAQFDGVYTIDNPHNGPIIRTTVFTGVGLENLSNLKIDGAEIIESEEVINEIIDAETGVVSEEVIKTEIVADQLRRDHDVLTIEFTPPLQPGESRKVSFTTQFKGPTLTRGSSIARNGTFVNNSDALIVFGNLNQGFLNNPDTRRKYDLGERMRWPDRDDMDARRQHLLTSFSGFADYVDFDAEVCTIEGQIPVAPGKFRGETIQDGRRCRSYKSINPILNFFSFLTADYDIRTDVWNGENGQSIDLEIYYHPEHDFNIDLMIDAMKTSMSTYTETFSPYQYAQLRIMEFPYAGFAQAFAGTVPFSESIGFVQDSGAADDPKQVDFATYVTMHEIGHQWFAHQVIGAYAKGSNLLSEGLTENATMLAYERHYDFAKARRMHEERTTRDYLMGRTVESDDEPVLAKAEGQGYLNYNKTSWVFWGMRGIIGNEPIQRAVKRFLIEHGADKGAPYPTTLELLAILKEETDLEYHNLIEDYWNKITFWDLSFQDDADIGVVAENGRFTVTLPLSIDKKYASEEDGEETSVLETEGAFLDEIIPIGFYIENPKDDLGANPMALEIVRINEAESTVIVTMDERPAYVVLDPARRLMERNVLDNVKTIDTPTDS